MRVSRQPSCPAPSPACAAQPCSGKAPGTEDQVDGTELDPGQVLWLGFVTKGAVSQPAICGRESDLSTGQCSLLVHVGLLIGLPTETSPVSMALFPPPHLLPLGGAWGCS